MKPTFLDKLVLWASPARGLRRIQMRMAQDLLLKRGYEAAKTYASSDWVTAQKTSANAEIASAQTVLQQKSRDLARNNPYALRALDVIVAETVGSGIVANIKGRNPTQEKRLARLWKEVAETSACDAEGRHNFYGLQALAMRSVVESGEVIAKKLVSPDAPRIQLLESDFIVSSKDDGKTQVQGIELDAEGRRLKYHIYKKHPGDAISTTESMAVPAENLAHVYRQQRPGQLRGVPWSHAVMETLKDFADYQYATLVRCKIAACFSGFITTNNSGISLTASELKALREAEMKLSPGTVRYLNEGESFQYASPPGVDGYAEFIRESMRATAAGYGISYEAMTGDYSQVNFSSGRMGHIQFRRNIDSWRWNMLIPQFCDPYAKWFLEWAKLRGYDVEGAYFEWVPPAHVMIDPAKEIGADKEAVKAGFKSRSQVIRESGYDPDTVREEIREEREKDQEAGLKFDTDIASSLPAETPEGNSTNEDKEDAPQSPDKGSGE